MDNTVLVSTTAIESIVVTEPVSNVSVVLETNSLVQNISESIFIAVEHNHTLLVERGNTTTVVTGLIGPEGPVGPAGTSEDDIMYSKRIDTISDELLYRGEATVGSSESSDVWRIRKITIVANDITETWASGNANFDKQWSNRLNYSYN